MRSTMLVSVITVAVPLLGACGTINTSVREEIAQNEKERKQVLESPMQIAPETYVRKVPGVLIPVTPVSDVKGEWLKKYRVQLEIRNPTPLTAVVAKLAEQGINITSDLPLDSYTYVGKVNTTNGEAALQLILGAVGLDYQVDDDRKIVVIKPMSSRTWILNIGNRKSMYSSDGNIQTSSSSAMANGNATPSGSGLSGSVPTSGSSAMGSTGTSAAGTSATGVTAGQSVASQSVSGSGSTGVASTDDFWSSLAAELKNRLSVMVPRAMVMANRQPIAMPGLPDLPPPPMPGQLPPPPPPPLPPVPTVGAGADSGSELYVKRQIGTYSLNPETGAITVQAPHWVLDDLDAYIKSVQEMYNTEISFVGELVLVTSNRTDSEGFDISLFAQWASQKYGAVVSNNALGGVTVSLPPGGGAPTVKVDSQPVAGPVLGLSYAGINNALDIFNAYLSEIGKVSVIQRPMITTTSGIPGVFSKRFVDYYNSVSQQAATGGIGSAATATQNMLVPVEYGTELRINPRIDVATGLVRAQITLNQVIKSGSKVIPQTVTYGNNVTTVNSNIPLLTKQVISGEVLLRDGDLIVVGGQIEDNLSNDESGLPSPDGPIGIFFGTKKASRGTQTYYFALRVVVNKRQ